MTSHKVIDDENIENDALETTEEQNLINCIAIDEKDPKRIIIATGSGVLISQDAGESWHKLSSHGLTSDYINFIVFANKKDTLFAATKKGVFKFSFNSNEWQNIYQGMTALDVRSLALKMNNHLFLSGTNRGIFILEQSSLVQNQELKEGKVPCVKEREEIDLAKVISELSQNEPSIRDVQQAALRYGEVIHPKRIKVLRQNAKLKALLPDVSLDYDKTIQSGGTSSNFGNFVIGPRDWGLSLSWDIGDLIFSEQVRLIDSNVRLVVQLRDDILNEVTRLYYERRKLQTEFILMPPETTEERLRIEELTANIDGLTGGYFSRNIKERRENDSHQY